LIVDDDEQLGHEIDAYLTSCGYTSDTVGLGEDAMQLLSTYKYDAIILDWALPDVSGFEVCTRYRRQGGQTPIVFLTGNNKIEALEQALGAGADDYIAKPFNVRELHARLKTILRRRTGVYQSTLTAAGLVLHPEDGKLEANGRSVILRRKEVGILECLMRNANVAYTAQELLGAVWPASAAPSISNVRVWVTFLRQKLAQVGAEDVIVTVAGAGYIIRDEGAN
jgi:DNA-binding response OmpR family regulator